MKTLLRNNNDQHRKEKPLNIIAAYQQNCKDVSQIIQSYIMR